MDALFPRLIRIGLYGLLLVVVAHDVLGIVHPGFYYLLGFALGMACTD